MEAFKQFKDVITAQLKFRMDAIEKVQIPLWVIEDVSRLGNMLSPRITLIFAILFNAETISCRGNNNDVLDSLIEPLRITYPVPAQSLWTKQKD